jgi:hypothetical protein
VFHLGVPHPGQHRVTVVTIFSRKKSILHSQHLQTVKVEEAAGADKQGGIDLCFGLSVCCLRAFNVMEAAKRCIVVREGEWDTL